MIALADRMKLVSDSITLAVSAKANALKKAGDEVIIPSPYWVSYPEQVKLAGGVSKVVRGEESNGFKITPQQLEAAIGPRTKVIVLNSPSNPAGHAYTPAELKALADIVVR